MTQLNLLLNESDFYNQIEKEIIPFMVENKEEILKDLEIFNLTEKNLNESLYKKSEFKQFISNLKTKLQIILKKIDKELKENMLLLSKKEVCYEIIPIKNPFLFFIL